MLETIVSQALYGISYGLLLFMLAAGLTLIFSMMGVLNFAHASFYMLGAYIAYQISTLDWLLARAGPRAGRAVCDRRAGRALGTCGACTSGAMYPSCCSPSGCRTSSSSWCR